MNQNWVRREELARHLIVSPNTISSWKLRYEDFPQPIGRYYNVAAVNEWLRNRTEVQSWQLTQNSPAQQTAS